MIPLYFFFFISFEHLWIRDRGSMIAYLFNAAGRMPALLTHAYNLPFPPGVCRASRS